MFNCDIVTLPIGYSDASYANNPDDVVLVQELEVVVGRYILFRCCLPMTLLFYFLGHSQIFIFSLANPPHNLNFTTLVA